MERSRWLSFSLVAALAAGCQGKGESPDRAPAPNELPLHGFTLSGETVSRNNYTDQVVLLNLWATWCKPCRDELPALRKLHERHAGERFTVIGVSVDSARDRDKVAAMVDEYGLPYPIVLDPAAKTAANFGAVGFPTSILLNKRRTVVWRRDGVIEPDDPDLSMVLQSTLTSPTR